MNNKKGILALLGIAAGAFAFWKYKNMTPAEKQRLKDKANNVGDRIKDTAQRAENTVKEKYDSMKKSAEEEYKDVKS